MGDIKIKMEDINKPNSYDPALITLWRLLPENKEEYIITFVITSLPELTEKVSAEYGPGKYQFRFLKSGKEVKLRTFEIASMTKISPVGFKPPEVKSPAFKVGNLVRIKYIKNVLKINEMYQYPSCKNYGCFHYRVGNNNASYNESELELATTIQVGDLVEYPVGYIGQKAVGKVKVFDFINDNNYCWITEMETETESKRCCVKVVDIVLVSSDQTIGIITENKNIICASDTSGLGGSIILGSPAKKLDPHELTINQKLPSAKTEEIKPLVTNLEAALAEGLEKIEAQSLRTLEVLEKELATVRQERDDGKTTIKEKSFTIDQMKDSYATLLTTMQYFERKNDHLDQIHQQLRLETKGLKAHNDELNGQLTLTQGHLELLQKKAPKYQSSYQKFDLYLTNILAIGSVLVCRSTKAFLQLGKKAGQIAKTHLTKIKEGLKSSWQATDFDRFLILLSFTAAPFLILCMFFLGIMSLNTNYFKNASAENTQQLTKMMLVSKEKELPYLKCVKSMKKTSGY